MKYLVVEDFGGRQIPFIFPDKVDHADMREQLPYAKIISGGHVCLKDGALACHGSNQELGINSRPKEDLEIILAALKES